jgi:hypothetical protein
MKHMQISIVAAECTDLAHSASLPFHLPFFHIPPFVCMLIQGHARCTIADQSPSQMAGYDGLVAVGGDGLFQEAMSGLIDRCSCRPWGASSHAGSINSGRHAHPAAGAQAGTMAGAVAVEDVGSGSGSPLQAAAGSCCLCSRRLRLGHIPAGSTDAVAYS